MSHVVEQPPALPSHAGPRWFPLNILTALVLATVFALLTFLLTSTGESAIQVAELATTAPVVTANNSAPVARSDSASVVTTDGGTEAGFEVAEVAPTVGFLSAGDSAAATSLPLVARAGAITNMGPTEIGYVTNFPSIEYTWQRVELPGAGISELGWLGELNSELVSVSQGSDQDSPETQSLVTRTSTDAVDWAIAGTYQLPTDTWVSRVVGNDDLVVAIAQRWIQETGQSERFILTTSNGVDWTTSELVLEAADDENIYINDVVMGAAGIAMSVQFESYPEEQPLTLVFESHEALLDHMRGTFTLTGIGSGEIVLTGSTDELFNWGGDGQNIYNPETGELLTTIPYEVWERSYDAFYGGGYGGSPLPIPIKYEEPTGQPAITVEYDGLVVTIDEYAGHYTVVDAESGDEIAAGTIDYLYQGPPPTFTDPETGDVLLAVTWDEWHQAEEQSYMDVEYGKGYHDHSSRTALVTSTDGETWAVETVSDGTSGSSTFLAATSDGFVAMVNSYGERGEWSTVWTMANGQWTATDAERSDLWLHQVTTTADGFIGVGDGPGGPALWSSPDGVSWSSEFAIVPQDDGSYAWLSSVTSDEAGTVGTLAVRERWSEYQPLVVEQEEYTATFEDGEFVIRVTETGSGDEVFSLGWEYFEEGIANDLIDWEDGATSIDLGNGDVMVITDDEAYAALETRYADAGQMGLSVFLNDGTGWAEAVVDVEGGISGASQLFLADGKIIIGGSYWGMEGESYYEGPVDSAFVIIVGTPRGG